MLCEKTFALSECNRVRLHRLDICQRCVGATDEMLFYLKFDFVESDKRTLLQQIKRSVDRTCDRVPNGRKHVIRNAFVDAVVERCESPLRHEFDLVAEQFQRSLFAERAALALKRHSDFACCRSHETLLLLAKSLVCVCTTFVWILRDSRMMRRKSL